MFVPYVHALPVAASGECSSLSAGGCPVINFVTDHETSSSSCHSETFVFICHQSRLLLFFGLGRGSADRQQSKSDSNPGLLFCDYGHLLSH